MRREGSKASARVGREAEVHPVHGRVRDVARFHEQLVVAHALLRQCQGAVRVDGATRDRRMELLEQELALAEGQARGDLVEHLVRATEQQRTIAQRGLAENGRLAWDRR